MELFSTTAESILIGLFLLLSFFSVTAFMQVTRRNRHLAFERIIRSSHPPLLWKIARKVAQSDSFEILQFFLTGAQQGIRVATILYFIYVLKNNYFCSSEVLVHPFITLFILASLLSIVFIFFFDFLSRFISGKCPEILYRLTFPLTSLSVFLFFPGIACTLKIAQWISTSKQLQTSPSPRELLIHIIDELDESENITEADQRLMQAVVNFKDRIAREIMRPRVNLFCLPETMSLKAASAYMQKEGYSRVPVYRGTIDSIIGIVFYKDILSSYLSIKEANQDTRLDASIAPLVKKIHYCPETKKISSLLQEFRKKQTHLAVVVDEYGGTSGLVTIEDILEELVGEIADEYDDVETYSQKIDATHWIVDARVNILDLEEETGIKIPQEGEYDTIAGYIFYRLGAIPLVGHVLHHDEYDMKIISCNDRMVEKVEIELHTQPQLSSED